MPISMPLPATVYGPVRSFYARPVSNLRIRMVAATLLVALDCVTSLLFVHYGGAALELNPLVRWMMEHAPWLLPFAMTLWLLSFYFLFGRFRLTWLLWLHAYVLVISADLFLLWQVLYVQSITVVVK